MPAELWPIIVLSALTLGLAVLWWPDLRPMLEAALGMRLPALKVWELGLSLALVTAGIAAGVWLARRESAGRGPARDERPGMTRTAAWLGLPILGERSIERPLQATTRALARFDDRLLGVVFSAWRRRPGHGLAAGLARFDDRLLGVVLGAWLQRPERGLAAGLLAGLARFDDAVVDAGLGATARFGRGLAALGARVGEAFADGLPAVAGWGALRGGRWMRAIHRGLVHQYYLFVVSGVAALALILLLGGWF
jgi:hypothetical protein